LVFQDPRLLPWKTVEENLSLAIRHLPEEERRQRIREVLELVRLPEVEALYPSELSGGMAQRVGLARGIIAKPDLLLLDEPFSALDFMTRSRLQMDFSKIQAELGMTMVLITHDVNEAVLLSDKTVFLDEGKVKQEVNIDLPKPRRFGDQNLLPYQQTLFNFFLT
jgi:ABC-type nitrate/sulfonate/bicarbonate transport system ATPase subunit